MSRLHLLMSPGALEDCLCQLAPGDPLVLLDRGVELLLRPRDLARLLALATIYHSSEDRAARGLPVHPECQPVSDAELVGLLKANSHVLSWT